MNIPIKLSIPICMNSLRNANPNLLLQNYKNYVSNDNHISYKKYESEQHNEFKFLMYCLFIHPKEYNKNGGYCKNWYNLDMNRKYNAHKLMYKRNNLNPYLMECITNQRLFIDKIKKDSYYSTRI